MRRRFVRLPNGQRLAFLVQRGEREAGVTRGAYIGARGLTGGQPTAAFWLYDSQGTRVATSDYVRCTKLGEPDARTLRAILDGASRILNDVDPLDDEVQDPALLYRGELAA